MSSRPTGKKLIRSADSPSLWNYTLSPGWTREDIEILRLAIMKFGLGAWSKIAKSNCLPGKTPSQLNLQTQRILGQQSLGEFMGLHVDARVVWAHNNAKQGAEYVRKNGCLINTGNNPTKEERQRKIQNNKEKFGLAQDVIDGVVLPTERVTKDAETTRYEKKLKLRRLKDTLRFMEDRLTDLKTKGVYDPSLVIVPAATSVDTKDDKGHMQDSRVVTQTRIVQQRKIQKPKKPVISLLDEDPIISGESNDSTDELKVHQSNKRQRSSQSDTIPKYIDSDEYEEEEDDFEDIDSDSDFESKPKKKKSIGSNKKAPLKRKVSA